MKITKIIRDESSKRNYTLIILEDDQIIEKKEIIDVDPKNEKILKLPENPSNRKWLSIDKIEKNGGELVLEYKESIKLGERTSSKKLEDYLTDEEKKIIDDIMNKARERREEDKKKPMSKEDKIRAQIEKYQKMLEKLEAEG